MTDLITADQAAARAGVSRRTISRWASTGKLPVAFQVPIYRGAQMFRLEDVDAAAAEQEAS